MTAPPRPEGPEDSPGFLLWTITLDWQRRVTAALDPLGLTHVQFVLLASLHWLTMDPAGAPPSQRQLAEHAGTDIAMTSTVLRVLERHKLIERRTDPSDARVRRLTPTRAGRELAVVAMKIVEAVDHDFFAQAGDRARTMAVLQALAPGSFS